MVAHDDSCLRWFFAAVRGGRANEIHTTLAGWGQQSEEKMARRDPNYIDVHVGSRIRMRRQLINMSQERLGELLGITFQQVQKYEKGANRISASRLFYTAKTLGVPIQFFFEGLPGGESDAVLRESVPADEFTSALMTPEGVQLAKAFRDADTATKRKLIVGLAKLIVNSD
jgi:transcriptional regulator with XRE-family HTH domain